MILLCARPKTLASYPVTSYNVVRHWLSYVIMKNATVWRGISKLLAAQLGLAATVAMVSGIVSGWMAAYSALIGGGICLLANLEFARTLFKPNGARASQKIVRAFYWGEAKKIMITA